MPPSTKIMTKPVMCSFLQHDANAYICIAFYALYANYNYSYNYSSNYNYSNKNKNNRNKKEAKRQAICLPFG